MSGDRAASLAFMLLALMLPLSALISRRMPLNRTLRLVLIWALIIAALAVLIGALQDRSILPRFT